jgi:uncharacterized membrane protein YczE
VARGGRAGTVRRYGAWRGHPWLLARRLVQLYAGLVLYGVSMSLQVRAGLGLDPWDVFHQGLSEHVGLRFGTTVIVVGAAVLLLWIPLRQRPGLGTVSNVVVIGLAVDVSLDALPAPHALPARWAFLVAGVVLNGVAIGCYIGAGFGPGPRDGLMTGLAARGRSIRVVRTGIELTVLAVGFLLGGSVGIGTLVYAVGIGPLAHVFIPLLAVPRPSGPPEPSEPSEPAEVEGPAGAEAAAVRDAAATP